MESIKVYNAIIKPLEGWFGKPMGEGRASVYCETLHEYPQLVLEKAIYQLKKAWTSQSMPQPASILGFCEEVNKTIQIDYKGQRNFGEIPNNYTCKCGEHMGFGTYKPDGRAKLYAWYRKQMPTEMNKHKLAYLQSYENAHGEVSGELGA